MNKKFLSLVLIVILAFSILAVYPFTVSSATYVQDGDWKYEMPAANAQEYYVAGYLGNAEAVRIPALYQSKPITKISANAFLNKSNISILEIPATITNIGMNAFYGCSALEAVTIPANVSEIGPNAFYGCTSLNSVRLNDESQLKEIPRNCFSGCTSIVEFTVPMGVTSIADRAFFGCTTLADITISPTVVSIGVKAFDGCESLRILGWNNTYAQQYAEDNNITFVSLGDYDYPEIPTSSTASEDEVIPTLPTTSTESDNSTPEPTSVTTEITSTEITTTEPVKTYKIGDTDLSGTISVKDATLIQKYAAGLSTLDRTQLFLANCNGISGVNIKDATQIQKYCAGFKNILFVDTDIII